MDRKTFFDHVRRAPFKGLSASQVSGMSAILDAWEGADPRFAAYALGTAFVETGQTMQPIKEKGGVAYFTKMYDIKGARPKKARELGNLTPGDGALYCGRGYVQCTGRANYAKFATIVGVDLVAHPDRAMEPAIAAAVMVAGMTRGLFTGAKLSQFFTATKNDWTNARTIINGHDRAGEIAGYARQFFAALDAAAVTGGVAPAPPTESPAPMPAHPIPPIVSSSAATAMASSPIGAILSRVLHREDVPIENHDVAATVGKVMTQINASLDKGKVAVVNVKPSWTSKINVLAGGALATAAGWLGFNIPQTVEEWARTIVEFAVPLLTIVLRTWFTSSVTAASMVPPITRE